MTRTATTMAAGLLAAIALLAGLTLLSACTSVRSGTATPATSAKPTQKPLPKPSATPAPTTLPTAANGTDLAACAAGSCEVTVAGPVSIPAAPGFGVSTIAVSAIGANTVSVAVTMPAGQISGDCNAPGCTGTFAGLGAGETEATGSATLQIGGTFTVNNLDLTAVAVVGGSAVLRLSQS
jgi:hypothetical protein